MCNLKRLAVTALAIVLGACGDTDNAEPPAELTPIERTHFLDLQWTALTDDEVGDQFIFIQPLKLEDSIVTAGRDGVINRYLYEDGEELTELDLEATLSGGVGGDEKTWLVATRQGEVIAINAEDETIRWRTRVPSEVLARPVLYERRVLVRTIDGQILGINLDSGKIEWSWAQTIPALTLRGTSEPVLARNRLFAGLENGRLVALSPLDGEVIWDVAVTVAQGRSEVQRLVDIDGHSELYGPYLYLATYQGRMAALDVVRGQFLWTREFSSHTGLVVDKAAVYATDDRGHIWALDRNNGATLWKQDKLQAREVTRPVLYKDFLLVGDFESYLHVLSRFDGRIVGRIQVGETGILVPPVIVGDTLYVLTRRGLLAAYELEPIVPLDEALFE